MKTKVYISKSNTSHIDELLTLRALLLDNNVTILEHSGGPYNPLLVKQADKVIVLPGYKTFNGKGYTVGKGLFTEAQDDSYIFDGKNFKKILSKEVTDENNWKDYALIKVSSESYSLDNILGIEINPLHLL